MGTNDSIRYWSDLAVAPGVTLAEELGARGMTQVDLAARMGRPPQVINEIIRGRKAITPDTAMALEKVLGIPSHFWLNLETQHQMTLARKREKDDLASQVNELIRFPLREMGKRGWIEPHRDKAEQVRALLNFFGIASFSALRETSAAFRISEATRVSPGALAAWLRKGELEGQAKTTAPYDEARFRESLATIRGSTSVPPEEFEPKMKELCASAGVAVVFVREFPRTGANGVARWLAPNKALIQMSLRGRWGDIFWFSFFHEAGHILRKKTHEVIIDDEGVRTTDQAEENAANAFAQDFLIPTEEWQEFLDMAVFTQTSVTQFAEELGIAPGIVVGRLQREGKIAHSQLNGLRERYEWAEKA